YAMHASKGIVYVRSKNRITRIVHEVCTACKNPAPFYAHFGRAAPGADGQSAKNMVFFIDSVRSGRRFHGTAGQERAVFGAV
ncbi:MAG: hypothetical protein ACI4MR_04245, partial [Candidatus Aphodomorpha sp.]